MILNRNEGLMNDIDCDISYCNDAIVIDISASFLKRTEKGESIVQ